MTEELLADELEDLELDGSRQVFVDDTGDLSTTEGIRTVEQSVMLNAADVLRPLVGQPISATTLESIKTDLADVLEADPQIARVNRVDIVSIDETKSKVTVQVFVQNNNSFEIGVDV